MEKFTINFTAPKIELSEVNKLRLKMAAAIIAAPYEAVLAGYIAYLTTVFDVTVQAGDRIMEMYSQLKELQKKEKEKNTIEIEDTIEELKTELGFE